MDAFKISIKIFATSDGFGSSEFMPVFQRWIQTHALAGHLLIDVADYAHVHNGPGTVLVTSEANLYTDRADGRFGLLYSRKLPLEGTFFARPRMVTAAALHAAYLLEKEASLGGRLKFRTNELFIRLNDRLLAPNTAETFAAVSRDVKKLTDLLYGSAEAQIEYQPSALTLFETRVKTQDSQSIEAILSRINAK